MNISSEIKAKASLILEEVKKAHSILLHCHPSPDPDSVGSALAMKFALEQLGKKVTVIKGDSDIPEAFMHFPGTGDIVKKNFFEVDLKEFDLFIVQDCGSIEMISRAGPIVFPAHLRVVVIDHHRSNVGYGQINLLEKNYPATAQILFDLFEEWKITITPDIAANLLMGIFTDTGGFKFPGVTAHTHTVASHLVDLVPDFSKIIAHMENSNTPKFMMFEAEALRSIETYFGGKVALAAVPISFLKEKEIPPADYRAAGVSAFMRTVGEWKIVGSMVEYAPGEVKVSFRSQDGEVHDVGRLAVALGGGGHKAAAGVNMQMPLEDAKKAVVAKAKELYNL